MIDLIRDGISLALRRGFPACAVYGDGQVRQGLENPCFFVGLGEYTMAPLPCGLREVRQIVDVAYFPEQEGDFGEMWSVGPQVIAILSALTLSDGSTIRGAALRCGLSDGLMHIHGVYRLRLKPVERSGEKMMELDHLMGV